jgi:hypothetical protein
MSVKITVQKDYFLTEVSIDRNSSISDLHTLMKDTKSNGKIVILYNGGAVQGISVEQKLKLTDVKSEKMRELLSITTVER